MVKSAIKGLIKKAKPKGALKRARGTPTKAGLVARRNMLRGETTAEKFGKTMKDPSRLKQTKKKPLIGKFEKGVATGAATTLAAQGLLVTQKKAKAEKDKLKKAADEHRKKDKKKKYKDRGGKGNR